MSMHPDQLHVDVQMVRQLVDEQFPQWRGSQIEQVQSAGTVNAIFRIGQDLAARFPLVSCEPDEARRQLLAEVEAAREFAAATTVPTTAPVAIGEPGAGYPMPWSVSTWLAGRDATEEDPAESPEFAHDLAVLITSMRSVDRRGRGFDRQGRGGHLSDHDAWVELCLRRSEDLLDVSRLRTIWRELRELPEIDSAVMSHRDLTPPNVLVRDRRLVGILDAGAFGPADPALDLVAAWHLLDEERRRLLRAELGCGDVQWRRGMAWALQQAVGLVWYYVDSNPTMSRWGRRTLCRIMRSSAE